ncbi:MAG: helix-turn-helix domain-containing protein [Acidobacteriota bacterium]
MSTASPTTDPARLLYSIEDAAETLALSPHTIRRDIRLGRISVKHYGRRILIPRAELERIAAEGMKPHTYA